MQSTPDNSKVGVERSLKQVIENKEISKGMERECKYRAHFSSRATRDID